MMIENRLAKIEDAERARLNAAIDAMFESYSDAELSASIQWGLERASIVELRAMLAEGRNWLLQYRAARDEQSGAQPITTDVL